MIRIFVVIAFFATLAQRFEAQNVPPPPPPRSEIQNIPPLPPTSPRSEAQNLPPLPPRSEGENLNYNNEDYDNYNNYYEDYDNYDDDIPPPPPPLPKSEPQNIPPPPLPSRSAAQNVPTLPSLIDDYPLPPIPSLPPLPPVPKYPPIHLPYDGCPNGYPYKYNLCGDTCIHYDAKCSCGELILFDYNSIGCCPSISGCITNQDGEHYIYILFDTYV